MAVSYTTTSDIEAGTQEYYNRLLLERAIPYLPHALFGQKRPVPMNDGDTAKFRKYDSLSVATAPLTEGVTPTGDTASKTDITSAIYTYGNFIYVTDKVEYTNQDKVLNELTTVISENAGESIDTIYRDILAAGTSVRYQSDVAGRSSVANVLSTTDVNKAIRDLKENDAKYFTKMVAASTNVSTEGIRPAFWSIIHPHTTYDIDSNLTSIEEYASTSPIHESEVGAYKNVRFIESTNAKVFTGGSTSGSGDEMPDGTSPYDVYGTLVFAKNAYGVIDLSSKAMETIFKTKDQVGGPLNQRSSIGWKAYTTLKILNENWMIRIEHLASE